MFDSSGFGKILLVAGLLMAGLGALLMLFGKIPFFGQLPGDVKVEGKNYTFYFPWVTCLVLSIILSVIAWIFSKFR